MTKKTVARVYIIVILVILAVSAIALEIYKKDHSTPAGVALVTASKPTSSNNSQKSSTTSLSSIVITKSYDSSSYLAEPNGQPLYTYTKDTTNVSNCTSSCLTIWPAYIDNGSTTNLAKPLGTIKRSNGQIQFTYNGLPLYTYVNDTNHSSPSGNNVAGFVLAKP